jgi:outer membrane receptor for ferrienterochelin and colicin
MDSGVFGKRAVYIVSGVRIAKTLFTVTKETGASYGIELSGSGPLIPGPVLIELGASLAHNREKTVTDTYDTAPGIVFAYRVHVIRYKRAGVETELF